MNKRILTVGFNGTALKNQHPKWTFASIPLPVKEHFIHWDFAFIFGPEFLTVDCKNKKRTDLASSWNDGFSFQRLSSTHRQKQTQGVVYLTMGSLSENLFKQCTYCTPVWSMEKILWKHSSGTALTRFSVMYQQGRGLQSPTAGIHLKQ